ncbi:MAG: hypothetical protein R2724_13215 [Bryobacterales bacterium]
MLSLRTPDVVAAVRLENNEPPGFWKTLRGQMGFGYSFSRGNTRQTQSSVTAQGDYRREIPAAGRPDLDSGQAGRRTDREPARAPAATTATSPTVRSPSGLTSF